MVERTILVVAIVGLSVLVVSLWQRRGLGAPIAVPAGVTLVTAGSCRDCATAKTEFDRLGVAYRVISVAEAESEGIVTRTVPTAIVGGRDGDPMLVRRGRSVITDSGVIADAAATAHGPRQ